MFDDMSALFQFTPARGGRRCGRMDTRARLSFNSRPREAGDSKPNTWRARKAVSIHARARRATGARREVGR